MADSPREMVDPRTEAEAMNDRVSSNQDTDYTSEDNEPFFASNIVRSKGARKDFSDTIPLILNIPNPGTSTETTSDANQATKSVIIPPEPSSDDSMETDDLAPRVFAQTISSTEHINDSSESETGPSVSRLTPKFVNQLRDGSWSVIAVMPIEGKNRYIVWDHKPICRDFNECKKLGLATKVSSNFAGCLELKKICNKYRKEDENSLYLRQLRWIEKDENAGAKHYFGSCSISSDLSFGLANNTSSKNHFNSVINQVKRFVVEKRFDITGRFRRPHEDIIFMSRVFQSWQQYQSSYALFYPRLVGHNCQTKKRFKEVLEETKREDPSVEFMFPQTSLVTLLSALKKLKKQSNTVLLFSINNTGLKNARSPLHATLEIISSTSTRIKCLHYDPFATVQPTPPRKLISLRKALRITNPIEQSFGNMSTGSTCLIRALFMGSCILDGLDYLNHLNFSVHSSKS